MYKILFIFILIILIIIIFIFLEKYNSNIITENYQNFPINKLNYYNNIPKNIQWVSEDHRDKGIRFLSSNELYYILRMDIDNYYNTFTKKDLEVRNIENTDEYISKIKESVSEFTLSEKNILKKCINIISKNLSKINLEYFDGSKANKIIWKIGCVKGNEYEDGLPHTRNDIIILNHNSLNTNINNIILLLIHEKVHIYQKMYEKDIEKYLKKFNFKRIKSRPENVRANPDIDNYLYKDDSKVYKAMYNKNASSVSDVRYSSYNDGQKSEHPFEKMAIEIEDLYKDYF
jgi:hypothetical protein